METETEELRKEVREMDGHKEAAMAEALIELRHIEKIYQMGDEEVRATMI